MSIDLPDEPSSLLIEQAQDDAPNWDGEPLERRIHDWRTHVGANVRRIWANLPYDTRLAIAMDAQHTADQEEWE